jgi:DNA repair protein RecO (recombination protein O)
MPFQERTVRTEAIVLKHKNWGEADRMLWIYTRKIGKVQAITRVNLLMACGRSFLIVAQAETIDAFLKLREDLLRVGFASYITELLDRFTYDEDDNQQIYRLLVDTLSRIDSESDPNISVRYFEVKLLELLGYRPELSNCVNCASEIQAEDQYFSISMGGALCPRCGPKIHDASQISLNTLKYLRHYQRSSYAEASKAQLPPQLNRDLEQLMQRYFTYFLERNLNTPTFIRRVKNRPHQG